MRSRRRKSNRTPRFARLARRKSPSLWGWSLLILIVRPGTTTVVALNVLRAVHVLVAGVPLKLAVVVRLQRSRDESVFENVGDNPKNAEDNSKPDNPPKGVERQVLVRLLKALQSVPEVHHDRVLSVADNDGDLAEGVRQVRLTLGHELKRDHERVDGEAVGVCRGEVRLPQVLVAILRVQVLDRLPLDQRSRPQEADQVPGFGVGKRRADRDIVDTAGTQHDAVLRHPFQRVVLGVNPAFVVSKAVLLRVVLEHLHLDLPAPLALGILFFGGTQGNHLGPRAREVVRRRTDGAPPREGKEARHLGRRRVDAAGRLQLHNLPGLQLVLVRLDKVGLVVGDRVRQLEPRVAARRHGDGHAESAQAAPEARAVTVRPMVGERLVHVEGGLLGLPHLQVVLRGWHSQNAHLRRAEREVLGVKGLLVQCLQRRRQATHQQLVGQLPVLLLHRRRVDVAGIQRGAQLCEVLQLPPQPGELLRRQVLVSAVHRRKHPVLLIQLVTRRILPQRPGVHQRLLQRLLLPQHAARQSLAGNRRRSLPPQLRHAPHGTLLRVRRARCFHRRVCCFRCFCRRGSVLGRSRSGFSGISRLRRCRLCFLVC
eukprot:Rhum_TRINITY_DN23201_c0_g1::Rhum_TRINITY_DN23201_c0_g1_i1::g.177413::m.177413